MDKIWIIWNPITRLKETEELESDLRNAKENPKDLAEIWAKYIQFELKKGDPVRIEFTYERATTQLCLNPSLWVQYLQWARKIKSSNVLSVAKRATRNCSWDAELWGRDWLFKFHQFETNMKSPLTSSLNETELLKLPHYWIRQKIAHSKIFWDFSYRLSNSVVWRLQKQRSVSLKKTRF